VNVNLQNPTAQTSARVGLAVAKYTGLSLLWFFQYCIAIPFGVWPWRAFKAAVSLGLIGLALLCIPVLGWIIIGVKVYKRMNITEEERAARRKVYRPWGI
jgi:hypothetical protein